MSYCIVGIIKNKMNFTKWISQEFSFVLFLGSEFIISLTSLFLKKGRWFYFILNKKLASTNPRTLHQQWVLIADNNKSIIILRFFSSFFFVCPQPNSSIHVFEKKDGWMEGWCPDIKLLDLIMHEYALGV